MIPLSMCFLSEFCKKKNFLNICLETQVYKLSCDNGCLLHPQKIREETFLGLGLKM
jgi:hypothetical protein